MSYFLFGVIACSRKADESREDKEWWCIVRAGQHERIHVILSPNIPQKLVSEMLGSGLLASERRAFMITSSPVRDTADLLISPCVVQGMKSIVENLARVGRWVEAVIRSGSVEQVELWMTEGFDDCFEEIHVTCDQFNEVIATRLANEEDVPSLRLIVE